MADPLAQFTLDDGTRVHLSECAPSRLYSRLTIHGDNRSLVAQALKLNLRRYNLQVEAHPRVLAINFAHESTRRDVTGRYIGRPGYYLSSHLETLKTAELPAIATNGNNVGYWGNQFILRDDVLTYKKHTPVFQYPDADDLSDSYTFLLQTSSGELKFDDVYIDAMTSRHENAVAHFEVKPRQGAVELAVGLSGYPLLRNKKPVWHSNVHQVWDPRLLYDTGSTRGLRRAEVLRRLKKAERNGAPMLRHAMTIIGLDDHRRVVVLVAEKSPRSDGISIEEAATLATKLGVEDAIVIGAAGDAQLGSTDEGILIWPLVSNYDREVSQQIKRKLVAAKAIPVGARERPVPSLLTITPYKD
jgi:hypothetical protein